MQSQSSKTGYMLKRGTKALSRTVLLDSQYSCLEFQGSCLDGGERAKTQTLLATHLVVAKLSATTVRAYKDRSGGSDN
jgi:hypothetical protein